LPPESDKATWHTNLWTKPCISKTDAAYAMLEPTKMTTQKLTFDTSDWATELPPDFIFDSAHIELRIWRQLSSPVTYISHFAIDGDVVPNATHWQASNPDAVLALTPGMHSVPLNITSVPSAIELAVSTTASQQQFAWLSCLRCFVQGTIDTSTTGTPGKLTTGNAGALALPSTTSGGSTGASTNGSTKGGTGGTITGGNPFGITVTASSVAGSSSTGPASVSSGTATALSSSSSTTGAETTTTQNHSGWYTLSTTVGGDTKGVAGTTAGIQEGLGVPDEHTAAWHVLTVGSAPILALAIVLVGLASTFQWSLQRIYWTASGEQQAVSLGLIDLDDMSPTTYIHTGTIAHLRTRVDVIVVFRPITRAERWDTTTLYSPYLCNWLGYGQLSNGTQYDVYARGNSRPLSQCIGELIEANFSVDCLRWLIDICHGLKTLHAQDMVHGNLTMETVWVRTVSRSDALGVTTQGSDTLGITQGSDAQGVTQGDTQGATQGVTTTMATLCHYRDPQRHRTFKHHGVAPDSPYIPASDVWDLGRLMEELLQETESNSFANCGAASDLIGFDVLVQQCKSAEPAQRPTLDDIVRVLSAYLTDLLSG
jgi:hypothetical protein